MTKTIVFVHGWALGPDFWDPIARKLPGMTVQRADLGFYGTPAKPVVERPFVIAHSLGLMWALEHLPRPWDGLIAVNSFTRFSRLDNFPGVEARLVGRMKSKLDQDSAGVAADFLRRCGMDDPKTNGYDKQMLAQGLDWLAEGDQRRDFEKLDCPILAVAGRNDPIVTLDHSRASFPHHRLTVSDCGGHLLPLTHTEWLASRINAALNGNWTP
jgi:pimeloyl-[acyl-carrier protein] methyl ester esterase